MSSVSPAADPGPSAVSDRDLANAVRALTMDAVEAAKSGHPGMPMGMADVATVLYRRFLAFDPLDPDWPDRDRLVLSAGHGSMLLYALLYLTGYPAVSLEQVKNFRQLGSRTAGHPEYRHAPGIETTTGPLGQGLANAVGMALAERILNARLGDALVDHYTYVLAGDGCLMEGISHEAIDLAGHLKLARLIVLFDDNGISIDGATSLATSTDQLARFAAAGWAVRTVDGHDPAAIEAAIAAERATDQPSLIACRTVIGFGAPTKAGTAGVHGAPLGPREIAGARDRLGWPHPPFEIPAPILAEWRAIGRAGAPRREAWAARVAAAPAEAREAVVGASPVPPQLAEAVVQFKADLSAEAPKLATRQSSQKVLEMLCQVVPGLIGGSADLTGSNGTKVKSQAVVSRDAYGGGYIHYGVREHGMAAAMNGIALHGGLIPFGGTFLVFSDYSRPAIRLAALMGLRVIHVMTHDSIGLGEDGPTHQPVEHLASLRAIPNLLVLRPADAVETAEAWQIALGAERTPSVLCLTRQGVPTMRRRHQADNLTARGGYLIHEPEGARRVTLIASGSEVELALAAAETLAGDGIGAAVVSMPCLELFDAEDQAWRASVLGETPRVIVEAAVRASWERYLRPGDSFIGMAGFGASAPASKLYVHFGITPDAVVAAARRAVAA